MLVSIANFLNPLLPTLPPHLEVTRIGKRTLKTCEDPFVLVNSKNLSPHDSGQYHLAPPSGGLGLSAG
jgi:hypothetical protein